MPRSGIAGSYVGSGFCGLVVKNLTANAGGVVSIPGLERSPGVGNGNPFQDCLGNPTDRGGWQAPVHEAAKSTT